LQVGDQIEKVELNILVRDDVVFKQASLVDSNLYFLSVY